MTNTQTLTIKLPYPMRHMISEIKARGGRFDSATKTWSLPDNSDNRALANQLTAPPPAQAAAPQDRVRNVATMAVELLNALKLGPFTLTEASCAQVVITGIPTV